MKYELQQGRAHGCTPRFCLAETDDIVIRVKIVQIYQL